MLDKTQQMVLMQINNRDYVSKLSRKVGLTNQSITKSVRNMDKLGLIKRECNGRNKIIKLTIKGFQIQNHFMEINTLLSGNNNF